MPKYLINRKYGLKDIPEFIRFQSMNPDNILSEKQSSAAYGKAIHWMSILQILWPDFTKIDHYEIEVGYLVPNDPDAPSLPEEWFLQMAQTIAVFWRIQLEDLYPNGEWKIDVDEVRPEHRMEVDIYRRC